MNHRAKFVLLFAVIISLLFSPIARADQPNNGYISYTDVGQGEPLVLIHAFPFDQRLWKPQQEGLKQHFRVITLDLWGFGRSAAVNGKVASMDEYAQEVKQLLDKLHIQKAIIGGESMGGYVTLAFLKHYPERASGLILSDTNSIADTPEAKAKRMQLAQDILTHGPQQFIHDFQAKAVSANASQQVRSYILDIMNEQTASGIAAALLGMGDRSNTSVELSKTQLPILIITGDKDEVLPPQQSYDMHALAKNSRLLVIADAGHLSNLEKADEWNKAVIALFAKGSS